MIPLLTQRERELLRLLRSVTRELRSYLVSDYETRDDPGAEKKIAKTDVPEAEVLIEKLSPKKAARR